MVKSKYGFTLIELLVVIAIIAMLLSIIMPALNIAKQHATAAVCLSNLNGLSKGWYLYADDNDSKIVGGGEGSTGHPDYHWVDRPATIFNNQEELMEKERAIKDGAMFSYVEAMGSYHCPGDRRWLKPPERPTADYPYKIGGYRSYSIVGGMFGVKPDPPPSEDNWWIIPHTMTNTIKSPGSKYVFVEEADGRGWNWGAWVIDPRGPGGWVDPLTIWHNGRSTLGYADGHAEKIVWRDDSTFEMSEEQKFYQPVDFAGGEGDDVRYMARNYPYARPHGPGW